MNSNDVQLFSSVAYQGPGFWIGLKTGLSEEGWRVREISALDSGEYRMAQNGLARLRVRWAMYPGFALQILRLCRGSEGRAVRVVTTNPFFAPWLVARRVSRASVTVNLLYDVFPDALEVAGVLRPGSWVGRIMEAIMRDAFRRCEATVFLGERIRRFAEERYGKPARGEVIPVGADSEMFSSELPGPVGLAEPVRLLYCGNMGRMHDTDAIRVAMRNGEIGLDWRFHASGSGYHAFRSEWEGGALSGTVSWEGPLAAPEWVKVMEEAQVGVVTLKRGAEAVSMPSKTYSAMAAGQAILAIAAADSDLAKTVRRHDAGWVAEPGDDEAIREVLEEIRGDREALHRKRVNAHRAARKHYDVRVLARRWSSMLNELGSGVR